MLAYTKLLLHTFLKKMITQGHINNRMLIEVEGISFPVRLVDLIVDSVRYDLDMFYLSHSFPSTQPSVYFLYSLSPCP